MKTLAFAFLLTISVNSQTIAAKENLRSIQLAPSTMITSVALGSCYAPQRGDAIWQAIINEAPQLFLMLGDNVYASKEEADSNLPFLKSAYQLLLGSRLFAQLRDKTEVLATWDDHDYGMNDAGASWIAKNDSEALFESIWGLAPDDPRRQREGIYFSRTFGNEGNRLQIILLDTRFFRSDLVKFDNADKSYQADPSTEKTLLGETQWRWLEKTLAQPADLRLLVSSVQVLSGNGESEGWYLFPAERQKLFALLKAYSENNIFLLSGDRHFSAIYQAQGILVDPLYELTASSMNQAVSGTKKHQLANTKEPFELSRKVLESNFMTLDIDWHTRSLDVQVIGLSGEKYLQKIIRFQ